MSKCGLSHRGESNLQVFESKILRKIFGSTRDEVSGEWGKMRNL
jgi:hypothetical protein